MTEKQKKRLMICLPAVLCLIGTTMVSAFWMKLTVSCVFLVSAVFLERLHGKRIRELTDYLEQINIGADGTVLQRKEDEFSHLQDEMYKTVTELYQTRESALKAKKNFAENLANIAHQLKTPITAVSLSLQLMKTRMPNADIDQMKRQIERLSSLEESLLTLSKIDSGTLRLEQEEVDIYTALSLAAENLNTLLEKKKVSVFIPEKGYARMMGDLEWTMEALMNLIKNCLEYSPEGGTIYCDYSWNPLYLEVRIWDEGQGFSAEDLPHLFERFYRGKRTGKNGAGIGLALSQSIFQLQNGNLSARNLPQGGACFEVRIYSH